MRHDTAELVKAWRGDGPSLRRLIAEHEPSLRAFVLSRLGPAAPVDDIVQESFARGLAKCDELRASESLLAWLCGIALRVSKEMARQGRRAPRTSAPGGEPALTTPLLDAAAGLPEEYATLIHLRFLDELDCKQIAMRLDMPLGTVTKKLSRAYAMLRERLGAGRERVGTERKTQGARS